MEVLKARRTPFLEERDACAAKGDTAGVARCNAELRKLNLAIQGVKPYEVETKAQEQPSRRRRKTTEDVLA